MSALTPEQIAQLRANDHDDLRKAFIIGNTVCLVVAVVSVILRFWARRLVKTSWGSDDWTIVAGLIMTAGFTTTLFIMTKYKVGRHIWWLDDPTAFIKLSLAAELLYCAAIPVIKTSILLLYRRIFPQQWINRSLFGLGAFIILWSVATIVTSLLQCTPLDSLWGESPKQHCIDYPLFIKITGAINIITDVAILALPMPSLLKLNLSAARKRLLIIMFLIGGIVCIASIVRLCYVNKIGNTKDATYDYAIPATISTVELCVGVLAACLPTYRPLITTIISNRRAMDTRRTSQAGGSYPKAGGSYKPVKDSLQIPISSHFFSKSAGTSISESDDMEMLAGNGDHKVQTHIGNDGRVWPGARSNEIRVMTSFHTT